MTQKLYSDLDARSIYTIKNLPDAVNAGDAVPLSQVEALVTSIGTFVGTFDASGGAVPTTGSGTAGAIVKGDTWRISVGGTITGIGGNDVLAPFDLLIAEIDDASVAGDFTGIQANIGEASETESGIIEIATNAEVVTGTDSTRAVVPSSLANYTKRLYTYNGLIGDGINDDLTVNHALASTNVHVSVYEVATGEQILVGVTVVDANNVSIGTFAATDIPATDSLRVIVTAHK